VLVTDLNVPRLSGWDLTDCCEGGPTAVRREQSFASSNERRERDARQTFDAFGLAAYVRAAAERTAPDRGRRIVKTT
jgi:hypothetical protein